MEIESVMRGVQWLSFRSAPTRQNRVVRRPQLLELALEQPCPADAAGASPSALLKRRMDARLILRKVAVQPVDSLERLAARE